MELSHQVPQVRQQICCETFYKLHTLPKQFFLSRKCVWEVAVTPSNWRLTTSLANQVKFDFFDFKHHQFVAPDFFTNSGVCCILDGTDGHV